MSYATVDQLREYLHQVGAGSARDAEMQEILDRAEGIISDVLGISFAAYGTATDKDVRADGGEYLRVPAYKAASLTAITEVSGRGTTSESEAAITDYVEDEEVRPYRVWRSGGWSRGTWYRVTAIWGYGPAPESVVEAEIEVAVNIWRSRDAGSFGTTIGEGAGSVSVNRALTWAQRSILDGVRAAYLGVVHA